MYNSGITLLLNFFLAINIPYSESRDTLYYEPISERRAVDSLVEIQTNQVLPVIRLFSKRGMELEDSPSLEIEKLFVQNGRIINGTQFTSGENNEQILFCPKENSYNNCLIPKDFQRLEPMQCAKEPTPVVQRETNYFCGLHNTGNAYRVTYEFCPTEESNDYGDIMMYLHEFCYDAINKKTIFTSHLIENTELLDSKVLRQEHNVEYSYNMEIISGLIPSNFEQLKQALAQEESISTNTEAQRQSEDQNTQKHVYKIQKLIPKEDMAFGSQRKSTHLYFNAELQHHKLILLWNEMNTYIRKEAKKMNSTGFKFFVNTGVFDLTPTPREDGQKSNVWAKVIYATREGSGSSDENKLRGMVILMNNFIEEKADHAASSNQTEKSIVDYCKDDSCNATLRRKFENVGGRVRCCSVGAEMEAIFHWEASRVDMTKKDNVIPLLRIPGIN